jgi:transcriptional regulator GlxA family with amidase domain
VTPVNATPAGPLRVGVLAYPGCFGAGTLAIHDLLLVANRVADAAGRPQPFQPGIVVARPDRSVTAAGGVVITSTIAPAGCDLVVVPGLDLVPGADLDAILAGLTPELRLIRRLARAGCRLASACAGAFLLAEAAALDGRRATTTWLFASAFARRYPSVRLEADRMIVTDGPVTTAAAFSASQDLAMELIRRHADEPTARRTARVTLVPDNRSSQAPYIDPVQRTPPDEFVEDVKSWLAARLADPYDLGRLADAFHVSTRTMLRRFAHACHQSPLEHLQDLRIAHAQRVLEAGLSVQEATLTVGYSDPGTFRRLFTRRVGLTPAAYRRTFAFASSVSAETSDNPLESRTGWSRPGPFRMT